MNKIARRHCECKADDHHLYFAFKLDSAFEKVQVVADIKRPRKKHVCVCDVMIKW